MRYFFSTLFALFVLTACGGGEGVLREVDFPNKVWTYADSLDFSFENPDTVTLRQAKLAFAVNSDYAYQNLYVQLKMIRPSGKTVAATNLFQLSDSTGKWFVEPTMGGVFKFETPLSAPGRLPETGKFVFRLVQFMRDDSLKGVESIKLSVVTPEAK